jgi:RNA polymerase sigma-70 factor, ECF subfamily
MSTNTAIRQRPGTTVEHAGLEEAADVFMGLRPRLQSIAYRIIGSWTDAEDIVQDAWVRWQTCERSQVRNATAFLVTMTTRLAINSAKSGRVRHERYVGHWPSEPVDPEQNPAMGPERHDALEFVVLLVLERLSPNERAAYVLRHAFDYPYSTIAGMLQLSETNARQVVSRAGNRLASDRRIPVAAGDMGRLVRAFVAAAERGDLATLEHALAA